MEKLIQDAGSFLVGEGWKGILFLAGVYIIYVMYHDIQRLQKEKSELAEKRLEDAHKAADRNLETIRIIDRFTELLRSWKVIQ